MTQRLINQEEELDSEKEIDTIEKKVKVEEAHNDYEELLNN